MSGEAASVGVEASSELCLRYDANGLVPAIATDARTGEALMLAYMNAEAVRKTLETGFAYFWSRSRKSLWRKGETSGNELAVEELRVDCDQDAVWLRVRVRGDGNACHTGARSCFFRRVELDHGQFRLIPAGE